MLEEGSLVVATVCTSALLYPSLADRITWLPWLPPLPLSRPDKWFIVQTISITQRGSRYSAGSHN